MPSQFDDREAGATVRGYDWKWRKARAEFLAENPLCRMCEERGDPPRVAEVVDHKTPHRLAAALASKDPDRIRNAQKLFWDRKNWQGLCKHDHDSIKQRLEKSGSVAGCDVTGRPLDPKHHWNRAAAT